MGPKNKYKRRKYLIDHGFQVKFFLSHWFQAIMTCSIISATTMLAIYCSNIYGVRIAPLLMAALIVVMLMLIVRWGNRVSHKVAGPMFRISKDSENMLCGNLEQRIRLRGGDQLQPLAKALNRMLQAIEDSIAKDRIRVEQAKKDLDVIAKTLKQNSLDAQQTRSIRSQLRMMRQNLESITSDFQLRGDENGAAARK